MRLFADLQDVITAIIVLVAGSIAARFLARSVLIGAVNMNLQYARLLSVGVKWLVTVLAVTIALEQLGIGSGIIRLAFGILFGGIVLALALAVGLGSKELVSRSLERETSKTSIKSMKEPVGHL
jgi:ABC-type Na+ efflux pump permease subunit